MKRRRERERRALKKRMNEEEEDIREAKCLVKASHEVSKSLENMAWRPSSQLNQAESTKHGETK